MENQVKIPETKLVQIEQKIQVVSDIFDNNQPDLEESVHQSFIESIKKESHEEILKSDN